MSSDSFSLVKSSKKKLGRPEQEVDKASVGGRVRAARKKRKLEAVDLAKLAECSRIAIVKIETGQSSPADPRTKRTLIRLAEILLDNFGEPWLTPYVDAKTESRRGFVRITQGLVAAGRPIETFESGEPLEVPEWLTAPGKVNFALRVHGDSMEEDYVIDNDFLVCNEVENRELIRLGQRVVVDIAGDGATYKRWERMHNGSVMLHPSTQNIKKHPVQHIQLSQILRVFAVTGVLRKM